MHFMWRADYFLTSNDEQEVRRLVTVLDPDEKHLEVVTQKINLKCCILPTPINSTWACVAPEQAHTSTYPKAASVAQI
jgi:hypothetical protein